MTGLSRSQVARLLSRYRETGAVREQPYRRNRFPRRYTAEDIELLAAVDEAQESVSGPAPQKILYREFHDAHWARLAAISVPHLYNLRERRAYRDKRIPYQKTRPVQMGHRRAAPARSTRAARLATRAHRASGRPGRHPRRVPPCSQRGHAGASRGSHGADQRSVADSSARSDAVPVPFRILGFRSDNGSEFIHHRVAGLLNKLLVEPTKSRPRHNNDNGLVEAKNGAVLRQHMGYGHIHSEAAEAVGAFYECDFNPHLNFHRPCGVPEIHTHAQGKRRRVYHWYATPWEILRQLPNPAGHLKADVTAAELEQLARAQTDTQAATAMQQAKQKLLARLHQKRSA